MLPTSLLPITGLIRRELLSSLRGSRYFYIVLLAVVIAGISIAGLWPDDNPMPWQMKNASQGIMIFLGLTLGGGAAISIPALAGSSIVSEREEETFELLAMSTAKPWHVLIAKLINSAGHYLLLVAALAPFAACAFFLIGVNTQVLWRTLLIISTTSLAWAAAGVLCSAKMKKPMAAVGVSYLAMIFILGLPWFVPIGVLELFGVRIADDFFNDFAVYVLPIIAFMTALGAPLPSSSFYSVEICSLLNIAITIVLILIAHGLVRRNWGMSERVEEDKPMFRRSKPVVHRDRPGIIPRPRHLFDGTTNPVYLREAWYEYPIRRWMGALQIGVPFVFAFCATGLTALVFLINFPRNNDWMIAFIGWHFMEAMLLPLLLAAMTANIFTKEHERENIDALRMTLLQPWEILSGKLLASLRVSGLLLMSGAVGSVFLVVTLIEPINRPNNWSELSGFQNIAYSFIMIAECLAVTWAVTAFCSILTRKMAPALVLSFVLSAIMLGGVAMMVIVVGEGMRMYRVQNWVGMFSPYFAYGLLIDDATDRYSIFGWNWSHIIVAAIVGAFLTAAAQLFISRHMRDR